DPTLRQVDLGGNLLVVVSDTVGFVQSLPHELVDAFRATLEEVMEADLILHVRDIADSESQTQKSVVESTLQQLGLDGDDAPMLVEVLNKCDLAPQVSTTITADLAGSRLAISAINGDGVDVLCSFLRRWVRRDWVMQTLRIPVADGASIAWCYQHGDVESLTMDGELAVVRCLLPAEKVAQTGEFNG
ncbi:MAG: hypothetical protein Q9M13_02445, partial [Mariprofundales bacterium]|nr:hypothetical protein [Mariprofundales bacterium]